MRRAAPLRFLALALCGWVALRAAMLWPDLPEHRAARLHPPAEPTGAVPSVPAGAGSAPAVSTAAAPTAERGSRAILAWPQDEGVAASLARAAVADTPLPAPLADETAMRVPLLFAAADPPPATPALAPLPAPAAAPAPRRWSGAAWLLVRREGGAAALGAAGTLGGSQAGGRIWYRLGRGLALSGRLYLPLRQPQAGDAAAGIDWQPLPALPVHLLAERRQAIGRDGRSDFQLTAYGGISRILARRLRLDAYAQAGVVGLRTRDPFVDGSARLSAPLGPIEVGAGLWGAAQPGAARLDAGPSLAYRLPVRRAALRLQADWRLRLAGDAAPGSGPALTLAMDF